MGAGDSISNSIGSDDILIKFEICQNQGTLIDNLRSLAKMIKQ